MEPAKDKIRFVDLDCGIGGFRYGIEKVCRERGVGSECVFLRAIDESCQQSNEGGASIQF
jgi:DNA (cytosine-5)-methyltransferase 1